MITSRTLPFDDECSQIVQAAESARLANDAALEKDLRAQWVAKVKSAMDETLRSPGFQLFLGGTRVIVAQALQQIAAGDRPEFNAGKIAAIEDIRARLRGFTDSDELLDAYDEGLLNDSQ